MFSHRLQKESTAALQYNTDFQYHKHEGQHPQYALSAAAYQASSLFAFRVETRCLQVPDAKIKYQQLLFYGKKLPPLPASEHTDDNKVRGCVSQVIPSP